MSMMDHGLHHSLRCIMSSVLLLPITHTRGSAAMLFPPPERLSLHCHLAALTLILHNKVR